MPRSAKSLSEYPNTFFILAREMQLGETLMAPYPSHESATRARFELYAFKDVCRKRNETLKKYQLMQAAGATHFTPMTPQEIEVAGLYPQMADYMAQIRPFAKVPAHLRARAKEMAEAENFHLNEAHFIILSKKDRDASIESMGRWMISERTKAAMDAEADAILAKLEKSQASLDRLTAAQPSDAPHVDPATGNQAPMHIEDPTLNDSMRAAANKYLKGE